MRVVIINRSDDRGGAAVVSRRLMHALRERQVEAAMLVAEKLTDDPNVHVAASPQSFKRAFLTERLEIFVRNGLDRGDLFKADTGRTGVSLASHPLVREADIVVLGWVNQGMLSLKEIGRIAAVKPVVWVMHDLWCACGVCHHPGVCAGFRGECGHCPLLHRMKGRHDLSYSVFRQKQRLYAGADITFVAVSRWVKERCSESALLKNQRVEVIHNPIEMPPFRYTERPSDNRLRMLISAARLDDPIKGLDTLYAALSLLPDDTPRMSLSLLGNLKDGGWPERFASIKGLVVEWHKAVPASEIERYYSEADLLLSPSAYETFGATLVEAQLYGALPVAFDSGGQRDIIDDGLTGVLAARSGRPDTDAANFAQAIVKAGGMLAATPRPELARRLYDNVAERFAAPLIADRFVKLFEKIKR